MDTVKTLKALANATRLEIVRMLLQKDMCIHALARHFQVSEATICVHIRLLREAGLVSGERKGYFVHYKTDREAIRNMVLYFDDLCKLQRTTCRKCNCHGTGNCQCKAKGKHGNETSSEDRN